MKRTRAGGSWQTGVLAGGYVGWDRIKRSSLYWGIDVSCAEGLLKGKTARGSVLRSYFTDLEAEARIGYTFQTRCRNKFTFVPFFGCGCVRDLNKFVSPSPITVQFHDFVKYVTGGFLAEVRVCKDWYLGANFTLKWMVKGTCNTSGDEEAEDTQLAMTNRLQYEVDVPITYVLSRCREVFTVSLVPFYEFRHYGGRENYPYDFLATKFNLCGLRAIVNYQF